MTTSISLRRGMSSLAKVLLACALALESFPLVAVRPVLAAQVIHITAAQSGQRFVVAVGTELDFDFSGGLMSLNTAVVDEVGSRAGDIIFRAARAGTARVAFVCQPGAGATCGTPFAVTIVVAAPVAVPHAGADALGVLPLALLALGLCLLGTSRLALGGRSSGG